MTTSVWITFLKLITLKKWSASLDQRISYGKQSAYDNAVSNEQMISEKALNSQDADLIRQQNNIPNTEFYKDNMYSVDEIRAQLEKTRPMTTIQPWT